MCNPSTESKVYNSMEKYYYKHILSKRDRLTGTPLYVCRVLLHKPLEGT